MKEVLCWCCEYFNLLTDAKVQGQIYGECLKKEVVVNGDDRVCELFLINSGLYTARVIPEYCLNHKNLSTKGEVRKRYLYCHSERSEESL